MNNNIGGLISASTKLLTGSDSARLDVELMLAHILDRNRTWLFTWPEYELTSRERCQFEDLLQQRIAGKPIAHILGKREFWGLDIQCDKHTLIPRPETELIVETALSLNLPKQAKVLDLGTGTGAIALALASEKPHWEIIGIDKIPEAVYLAQSNAGSLNISNVDWYLGSWFEPLSKHQVFDLIVSNPPYVEENSPWLLRGDVRFEPHSALTSGSDGLKDIRQIVDQSAQHLQPEGVLIVEHGFDQAKAVSKIFSSAGFRSTDLIKDYAGLDRITLGHKPRSTTQSLQAFC